MLYSPRTYLTFLIKRADDSPRPTDLQHRNPPFPPTPRANPPLPPRPNTPSARLHNPHRRRIPRYLAAHTHNLQHSRPPPIASNSHNAQSNRHAHAYTDTNDYFAPRRPSGAVGTSHDARESKARLFEQYEQGSGGLCAEVGQ